jgi:hypothetical protein
MNAKRLLTDTSTYGGHHINSKHCRDLTKQKLGVEYAFQLPDVLVKCGDTMFEKTGFRTPMENPVSVQKMIDSKIEIWGDLLIPTGNYKSYTLPSGKVVKLQGHENLTLDLLLTRLSEEDLVIGRYEIERTIGNISYTRTDGTVHTYYPDLYVKSENKVYETKCQYTLDAHLEDNLSKRDAVINKNIAFEFMIFNGRKKQLLPCEHNKFS